MNVLVVGTGTVGEAIAHLIKGKKWLGTLTLADYSLDRARTVADAVGAGYKVAQVDAGNAAQLKELIASSKADLVLNAVDPRFVPAVFDAALEAGVDRDLLERGLDRDADDVRAGGLVTLELELGEGRHARLEQGDAAGLPMPLSRTHRAILEEAEGAGLGTLDNSAIISVLAARTKAATP